MRGKRGALDSVGAALLVATLASALVVAMRMTADALGATYVAVDERDGARVRCRMPLVELLERGPVDVRLTTRAGAPTRPCLPDRTDHAAPGRGRTHLPAAFCALAARARQPGFTLAGLRCASH